MFVSYQKKTDKIALWERYVKGDKEAFGQLYSYYHKTLTAYCMGWLKNMELAENAASETLVKLLQYPRPDEISNFEGWLFTVAKNECTTYWSTTERRRRLLDENYEQPVNHSPEIEDAFSMENMNQLIRDHLDDTDYRIWQLHQQGYDNHEVAQIVGMNEKTVANRKSAARNKLRDVFKKYSSDAKSL